MIQQARLILIFKNSGFRSVWDFRLQFLRGYESKNAPIKDISTVNDEYVNILLIKIKKEEIIIKIK